MVLLKGALLLCATGFIASGITVTLTPSIPTPAPLGQMVTWQAASTGGSTLRYRFRVRTADIGSLDKSSRRRRAGAYQTIRDYSPASSLTWTNADHEGKYA